jgi:flavorubredoxin
MGTTNPQSGTNVQEIADGIYRINTPVRLPGESDAFSFNQYLIDDDEPLLFHTGLRQLFPVVQEAVESIIPVSRLRHVGFSHVEADECGSLNQWLAAAPRAAPLCGAIAAMVSVGDLADRSPRPLGDREALSLGRHRVRWYDAPHLPHGWECGYLMEETTGTLLCGDLFTQPGPGSAAVTESDILGPSEAFRRGLDYFSHGRHAAALLEKLAQAHPSTLACMHGSAWRGDGAAMLRALSGALAH